MSSLKAQSPSGDPGSGSPQDNGNQTGGIGTKLGHFFNKVTSGLGDKAQDKPRAAGSVSILDTKLDKLLANNPATSSRFAQWPRIAISDIELPASILHNAGMGQSIHIAPDDCVYFKATIWTSETESEALDKVSLCGSDMQKAPDRLRPAERAQSALQVLVPIPGDTTGAQRTTGPKPPKYFLDQSFVSQNNSTGGMGPYGGAFRTVAMIETFVGYEPHSDLRRFWVVNFTNLN